ncbi:tyrosine-type recombinase/integrase [Actinomadura harenae]|uniref:Site-specific integrase n=1 Tax=Actinomadura harenae TaxID=2483351 RepID=A0A3M2LKP9_9ACTN|nr:site-specific integrase [Actinomadura harenae]RMI38057.1 site-specific integrase [Actinomadura harenae]
MARGNKKGHRRFGLVRELPSGRYQASYLGPTGKRHNAPETFARKSDAEQWLTLVEAQMIRGDWIDPELAKVKLVDYTAKWIKERPGLRPRTVELYERLLRLHIAPHFGEVSVGDVRTSAVRSWRMLLLDEGVSESVTAKAYRLLRAVFMTAVKEDEMIQRNPCRIKGAGDEHPEERPALTLAQVFRLADLVGSRPVANLRKLPSGEYRVRYTAPNGARCPIADVFPSHEAAERAVWELLQAGRVKDDHDDRYRALVLLAALTGLRWGEAIALRRCDLDTTACTVRVTRQYLELDNSALEIGPPKSRAGRRTVPFPRSILPAILDHLESFTDDAPEALVFTSPKGMVYRRGNFRRGSRWAQAAEAVGVPGLHFHDLRHTGNTIAAGSGASLRDLMARMGQDSPRAAMIYQHETSTAGQAIAAAIDAQIKAVVQRDDPDDEGPAGALVPVA